MGPVIRRMFLAALAIAASGAASAADGDYLFDLLKKPAYRQAWNAMMANERPPQWLAAFGRGGSGVASPATGASIDGLRYELGHVCKPHDCADNRFQAMFTAGGGKAWGLLLEAGRPAKYFGSPTPAQRTALRKAMQD